MHMNRINRLKLLFLAMFTYSFSFAQIKYEDLKIDTTITGFHFAGDVHGSKFFTKNGPSDLSSLNPSVFSILIEQNISLDEGKEQLEIFLRESKESGFKISNLIRKDTTLNGNSAFYISYEENLDEEGYHSIYFNAIVVKDETIIFFASADVDRGKYYEKFKKTFFSISI